MSDRAETLADCAIPMTREYVPMNPCKEKGRTRSHYSSGIESKISGRMVDGLRWRASWIVGVTAILTLCVMGRRSLAADESMSVIEAGNIVSLQVEPPVIALSPGNQRSQILVSGQDKQEHTFDLTRLVEWKIHDPGVATIDNRGRLIGQQPGQTTLNVGFGEHRLEIPVTVAGGSGAASVGQTGTVGQTHPVSFHREVVPGLTQAGCNSGQCHGTPTGKNGFRLSLRGYDQESDLATLTREVSARRINHFDPANSLLLLKAAAEVPHGGGRRLTPGDAVYRTLSDWIAQGAPSDLESHVALERLEIMPSQRILEAPGVSQQLRVVAQFDDGSRRDVTHLTRFSVNDETLARVTSDGLVEKLAAGEVVVSAEYISSMATADLIFLEPVPEFHWQPPSVRNEIDRHVFAKLQLLRIEPSPVCSDEEFVRRVFLDTIGQLPSVEDVRSFLNSDAADKRETLIDALLDRPEFADWWAMKWTDRLGCNQRFVGKIGAIKYHQWIRHAMAVNLPEDEFVRAILTTDGPNYSSAPASFWRRLRVGGIGKVIDPQMAAEEISQLFLGVRIQCARCHNHPGERWTQDDYYGLAAFFPRIKFETGPFFNHVYDKEDTVYETRKGEITHPRTKKPVPAKFLGGAVPDVKDGDDRRVPFAQWLTAPDNPFFARAAVNRIWYHLFGRGIVEPVDDFRSSNPPMSRQLLESLTADFVAHGFDRKHLIRTILNSSTYQLSSQTTPTNDHDVRYFSHTQVRLLGAEQLLDAVCTAAETSEQFPGYPLGTTSIELPDGEYKHPFLEAFGRPARALACECERDTNTNLIQALHLVSGRFMHQKIRSDQGRAARLSASSLSNAEVIEELFLATLSRRPTPAETELLVGQLNAADATASDRRQIVEDILWSLLNHQEFMFQH